jgi:nucleotide-binding universal stress UspA family protein
MVEPLRPARILVPTDFSTGAEVALGWARSLGAAFSAEVILLHVVDLSIAALAGFPSTLAAVPAAGELLDRIRTESDEEMRRLTARLPGSRGLVREGTPRSMILDVAREVGAEMIVMGTHGRTGLTHVFFGSVAEHVVRHSRVPVLTVRQQE